MSRGSNRIKPDLTALFRLEFYRNKNKWKLHDRRTTRAPSSTSTKDDCNNNLNQTYDVDSGAEPEEEKVSPLNEAFIHEIPTDDSEPLGMVGPVPPPPSPSEELPDLTPDPDSYTKEWSLRGSVAPEQAQKIQEVLNNTPENPEPLTQVEALRWLFQNTNMDIWQNQPPPSDLNQFFKAFYADNPEVWTGLTSDVPPYNPQEVEPPSPHLVQGYHQGSGDTWQNAAFDGAPSNNLHMLLCPDKWKPDPGIQKGHNQRYGKFQKNKEYSHSRGNMNQQVWTDASGPDHPNSNLPQKVVNYPHNAEFCPKDGSTQVWANPHMPQIPQPPENWVHTESQLRSNTWLHPDIVPKADTRAKNRPAKLHVGLKPGEWTDGQMDQVSPDPQQCQGVWYNQEWEKMQTVNLEQATSPQVIDVPDGFTDDAPSYPEQPVYQSTVKSVPQGHKRQDPHVKRCKLEAAIRKVLELFNEEDDSSDQLAEMDNSYLDFKREALVVPHSSEKDPDETYQCICNCVPRSSLRGVPDEELTEAIIYVSRRFKELLREHIVRDQIRQRTLLALEQFPTRDIGPHDTDIIGGSHMAHPTYELQVGLIRIDRGRPYRLVE